MLAWMAAILILAGAPHDTTTVCSPGLSQSGLGLTYPHHDGVVGRFDGSGPPLVELAPSICSGLLLAHARPAERKEIERLNPELNVDQAIGVGLLVALHESQHAAGVRDETDAQCAAMRELPALLSRYLGNIDAELRYARASDAALPGAYHTHPCN